MRSFLGWVLLLAILATAASVVAPLVARPLVADAVHAVSPFGAQPLAVDVDVDSLELVTGKIRSIHVSGTDLASTHVDIGRLDATVTGVGILDHDFDSITGTLESVALRRNDGTEIRAAEVDLSGSSDAVEATSDIDADAALEIVRRAFEGAGLPADDLELIDGGVRMSLLGQKTDVALGAVDGAVTIAGSIAGGGSIVVFGPEAGDPWQITGVGVSPDGFEVHALLDLGPVLRGR